MSIALPKLNVVFQGTYNEVLEHQIIDKIEEIGFERTDRYYDGKRGITVIIFEEKKQRRENV